MDVLKINGPVTKDEAAKLLGCVVYDCAPPQSWLDKMTVVME